MKNDAVTTMGVSAAAFRCRTKRGAVQAGKKSAANRSNVLSQQGPSLQGTAKSTIRIRRFQLEDIADVIDFSKRAYGYENKQKHLDDLRNICETCIQGYYASPSASAKQGQSHPVEPDGMFVAEVDGRVRGTCFAFTTGKEDLKEGVLTWVGVDPAIQSRGLGGKLLKKAEDYLISKGVRRICLGTDRPLAMPFYLKHGYGIVNWGMIKRLPDSRKPKAGKILEAMEEATDFRFTSHNEDPVLAEINGIMRRRINIDGKISELVRCATKHTAAALAPDRLAQLRMQLVKLLGK